MSSRSPSASRQRERKRLLITGASGYLGRRLSYLAARDHQTFAGYGSRRERVAAGMPVELDLLRPGTAAETLLRLQPDVVIHAAAINPGGPEDLMPAVNVEGTRQLAAAAAEIGAHWVQVSTDVVHDGLGAPYGDAAEPAPASLYGRTKAAGESAVLEVLPAAAVVRTSLIYGLHEIDHGTRSFAERLRRGQTLRLFSDVLRQPIWVETLARALLELARNRWSGFLNVAGSQVLSREQFGRRMLDWWRVDDRQRVASANAEEVAPRVPRDLRLRLDRARRTLEEPLLGVDEVLAMRRILVPSPPGGEG